MTKNYYELLGLPASAGPEEIKRAFRREIARYHPDKVQHLGHEFQEIAATRASALNEAYRTLMDTDARRRYDEADAPEDQPPAPARQKEAGRPAAPPDADGEMHQRPDARVERARASTVDFVTKAALRMVREAITAVADGVVDLPAPGFDAAYVVKGKRAFFGKKEPVLRLLAKIVPQVDGSAVGDVWPLAVSATAKDQVGCVLLMGNGLAPSKELAAAVSEQRRKAHGSEPVIVPVDVRDWEALLPPEVPPSVRALLLTLKEGKK